MTAVARPAARSRATAAALLAVGTVGSASLSLLMQALVVRRYGVAPITDAFLLSRGISDLASKLLMTGHVAGVFAPMFAARWLQSRSGAWALTAQVQGLLLAAALCASVFVVVAAGPLVSIAAPGFTGPTREMSVVFLRILFPLNLFTVQTALGVAVLNTLERFVLASVATLVGQGTGLATFVLLARGEGTPALVWSTVVTTAVTGIVVAWGTRRAGFRPWMRADGVASVLPDLLRKLAPFAASAIAAQVSTVFYTRIASQQEVGGVTALQTAYRIFQFFVLVAVTPWLTVYFPGITFAAAEGGAARAAPEALRTLRRVLVATLAPGVVLGVFSGLVVSVLFERGRFGPAETARVAPVLAIYAIGTLPHVLQMFLYRYAVALGAVRTANVVWVAMSVLVIPTYAGFAGRWGVAGLAWAQNASNAFVVAALGLLLTRRGALPVGDTAAFALRLAVCLLATVAASVGLAWVVREPAARVGWGARAALSAAAAAAALAAFVAAATVLRLAELRDVVAVLRRAATRVAGAGPGPAGNAA